MNVEKRIDEIRAKLESDLPRKQSILCIFEIGKLAEEVALDPHCSDWQTTKEMIVFLDSWEQAEMREMATNEENRI